jgi:uncharacterized protein (TIGR02246 family)
MQFKSLAPVFLGLGLTVGLVACAQEAAEEEVTKEAATQTDASADLLAEVRGQYEEHYNLGHAPAVADLYTKDGVYMPSNGSFAAGRDAINGVLEGSVAASPSLRLKALETVVDGDVAFERGNYAVEMTPEGAEPVSFSGHYLTFSKRQADGSWKLHWVLSNYDAEPPAEVAASMTPGLAAGEAGGDAALDALREEWQSAYNQGDAAGTAALHTEDGFVMFADAPALEGRAAFAASLDEVFAASPQNEITQIDTEIIGDWAVARGTYEQQMTSPEGEEMSQSGYWLYVGRKGEDGAWRIHWMISNAVAPSE